MMRDIKVSFLTLLWVAFFQTACDDGRIYEENFAEEVTGTVSVSASISGIDQWPKGYHVAIAGFCSDNEYAIVSKPLSSPKEEGGLVQAKLSGLTSQVATVEICAIDALRRKVATFYSVPYEFSRTDTLHIQAGTIQTYMYDAIQLSIFNSTCTACHGGGGSAAAGLYLTEAKSYEALMNSLSKKVKQDDGSAAKLVVPGDGQHSVLYQTLSSELSQGWRINHSQMVFEDIKLNLIHDWIENGCK